MSIVDIISKECREADLDPAEKMQLNQWLNEDPKNQRIYSQLKLSLLYPDYKEMDSLESEVWSDLKARLGSNGAKHPKSRSFSWIYRVAAILVLGLAGTLVINKLSPGEGPETQLVEVKMIEKVTLPGQKITTTLPDGTIVKLNSESKLIVPEQFHPNQRIVDLSGEAFFEVVENKESPFIVKSGNMEVKVLGTSFNVRAYQEDPVLKVGVKTGKVEVKGIIESQEYMVTLMPNDMSTWNPRKKHMEKEKITGADAVFGWTEQKLVFENHSLPEVLVTLSKWYDVKFIDQQNIAQKAVRKYTAKYKNPTLEQMMISVAHVYDFEFEIDKTGNEIILK